MPNIVCEFSAHLLAGLTFVWRYRLTSCKLRAQAAACGADGEEVETGEAGRNWQRPPPPPLNPKAQPLGERTLMTVCSA